MSTHGQGKGERRLWHMPGPIQSVLGGVLLFLSLLPVFSIPLIGYWLLATVALYTVGIYFLPRLWLLVLPLLTVGIDLASWTGRFLYNELDVLFLATIASGFIFQRYRFHRIAVGRGSLLVLIWLILIFASMQGWMVFLDPPASAFGNPYYLPEYSYKLARGVIWAALLAPLWIASYRRKPQETIDWLVAGLCSASLLLGLLVLWERGTLGVLLSGSAWYHVVNSLLDLSSSYRVTGIFTDMHTGGEVLDGIIVLFLPASLYGVIHWSKPLPRIFATGAFLALCYCTLVGFTRTTYASVALGVVLYLSWQYFRFRRRQRMPETHLGWAVAALVAAIIAAYLAFSLAGSYGLVTFAGFQLLAYLAQRVDFPRASATTAGIIAGLAVLLTMAVMSHFNSRWVTPGAGSALLLVTASIASFFISWHGAAVLRPLSEFNRLFALGGLVVFPTAFAFALGGSQMGGRMASVERDMLTRIDHWQRVIDSSEGGIVRALVGNGTGVFPSRYLATYPETVGDVGSFIIESSADSFLRLGAGRDLAYGQRLKLEPDSRYQLQVKLRTGERSKLVAFYCERNLIFASNFVANCRSARIKAPEDTGGEFVWVTAELETGRVGQRPAWKRWPTTLYFKNLRDNSTVEIASIKIQGPGNAVVRNGDFSEGMDHWFFYNDFAHLPWHIKNTWLQVWYDMGWVGLLVMIAMVLVGLRRALTSPSGEEVLPWMMTGVLVLLVLGLFGTPLDSARVNWLFWLYLFVVLLSRSNKHVRA